MTVDYITRKEFQAYKAVQEKEAELRQHTKERNRYCIFSILPAGAAIWTGVITLFGILNPDYMGKMGEVGTAVMGCITLVNTSLAISNGSQIIGTSRQMGSLEKELEQLKAEPEYKALSPE